MPFRDRNALESRVLHLERELEAARASAARAESDELQLVRQLDEARELLRAAMAGRVSLPLLDRVQIAAPCDARWDDMKGDDRVRFCGECKKNVYDLRAMTRSEAELLLRDTSRDACLRIWRRADGTVITSDCEVGVKKRRSRRRRAAVVIAIASSAVASVTTTTEAESVLTASDDDVRAAAANVMPRPPRPRAYQPLDPTPARADPMPAPIGGGKSIPY